MMNNNKIVLAVIIALAAAVALAPTITGTVLAVKQETTTCTNGGGQTKECGSPPAKLETTTCSAGSKGQTNPTCP